jgi:hypothetical protein
MKFKCRRRCHSAATDKCAKQESKATKPKVGPDRAYGRDFGSEQDWLRLVPALTDERDALQLSGDCPLCRHGLDDFVSLSPEWVAGLRDTAEAVITTVQCNCSEDHAGRPASQVGCGAVAVVTVELSPTGDGYAATVKSARRATLRDRSWDDEAAKWEQAATERISETAEKWGQTIAALFALFGLGLVFEDDRVEKVISSSADWPWWVLVGLLLFSSLVLLTYHVTRREPGEPKDKLLLWAGMAGLVLSAVAVALFIPDLSLDAGPTFGVLAGVAAGLALAATAFAGLAAQGSPKWISYLTGNRMRALRLDAADKSVRNLRRARIATVLSIVGLGAALAVLWYAPVESPGKQQVRLFTTEGDEACGELVPKIGRGIAIDPPGDADNREEFSPEQLARVTAVDSCD